MKTTIGPTTFISLYGRKKVPAKIDTGADLSAIWASNITVTPDGVLKFSLFNKPSQFYNGKILKRTNFSIIVVKSSNGATQVRYRTQIPIVIKGQKIEATFTLADRSKNNFPVLIGKHTLRNKFLVDVAKNTVSISRPPLHDELKAEFQQNPYQFHQKYFNKKGKE